MGGLGQEVGWGVCEGWGNGLGLGLWGAVSVNVLFCWVDVLA